MRERKFRAFDRLTNKMVVEGFHIFGEVTMFGLLQIHMIENPGDKKYDSQLEMELARQSDMVIMDWTGHQINGKDLYESDVVRVEEDADGVDPEDKITHYVVTWIAEWCMFALLRAADEYSEYINEGTEALDTTMFWTFQLDVEDIWNSKHYLCGNIYEHPHLIQ